VCFTFSGMNSCATRGFEVINRVIVFILAYIIRLPNGGAGGVDYCTLEVTLRLKGYAKTLHI
jgi:hypothetical protein